MKAELHGVHFRAMDCQMAAWVVSTDAHAAKCHLPATRDFILRVESKLSRFQPESELSGLNARPGQTVRVSPLLWEVIALALDAARRTGGLYDPTVVDALETAGYDRPFREVVSGLGTQWKPQELRRTVGSNCQELPRVPLSFPEFLRPAAHDRRMTAGRQGPSWGDIVVDSNTRGVTLPPGVRLDLAGIAKGWVAERAADRLSRLGPCLVDAGGDIAARGSPPGQPAWPVGVADPRNPHTDLALIPVRDQGVATSGVDYRRWTRDGVLQHHIIDPRTARPAPTDLLTVTVVAGDAIEADLHALVVMILGADAGFRYLECQPGVEGLLLCADGRRLATPGFREW
jgi:thiamine biosynthesis lipoprotein